jgi:hypothetical protein
MAVYKKTKITIETERVLIIHQRSSNRRWCPECCRVAEMVGFAQATALTGVPQTNLRECARAAKWHVIETDYGSPLICLDSLLTATGVRVQENETAFVDRGY